MGTPRPGADAHLSIPSLITGAAPRKPDPLYLAPTVNAKPKEKVNMEPKKRGRPAKPATVKTLPKDEDYSTPYKPPVVVEVSHCPLQPESLAPLQMLGLSITSDPLPVTRAVSLYKYHPIFDRMEFGQSLRTPTANVGKVAGAMRKWIGMKGKTAHVKSSPRYCDDSGYGRVWLLAGASQMPSRKNAA
ncbi:MAG: hypothetical protein KBG00_10580 [Rhodoferax sp.]|jgi:hypothetical protein|uniref:hypothetical protein n=1 Tax=Rhodoferax sp. TaxID=50421 RepID=UPI001B71037A|nr:hypothetical protein [Rhodoferax sp.]MBP9149214.1 hypothetical protein [Rhodoferax sp.]MBP9736165.1 hypothetical protein [Rhodoferax sp.]